MSSKAKRIWIWVIAVIALVAVIVGIVLIQQKNTLPRDRDREFQTGTEIRLEQVTEQQTDSLYKLCKVWGYAKYHHPQVVDGTLNWDAELFRILPKVLDAKTSQDTNDILLAWLQQFPFEPSEADAAATALLEVQKQRGQVLLSDAWIQDRALLGDALSGTLQKLSQLYLVDRENAYASFAPDVPWVSFENEENIAFRDEDAGVKLLSLFRFWNVYEYYSPNLAITKVDWDDVLKDAIPKIIPAKERRAYVLAISEVTAATGDAHIAIYDPTRTVQDYYGTYFLPCKFKNIGGEIVVSQVSNQLRTNEDRGELLLPGDILKEVDGHTMTERLEVLSRYTALPEADKFVTHLGTALLKSTSENTEVKLVRNGKPMQLTVTGYTRWPYFTKKHTTGLMENGQVGYIDPSTLREGEPEKRMEEFASAKGMIVDLRAYPSVFLPYLLGEYIVPEPTDFAKLTFPNPVIPGAYFYEGGFQTGVGMMEKISGTKKNYPFYPGKIAILMDETSLSQSEFTIMALRQAPNALVIGTPSIGADGNVVELLLPGGLRMSISGLGIYLPDGGQTQRVGLTPDLVCESTVQGLREERDEYMEKAIDWILSE